MGGKHTNTVAPKLNSIQVQSSAKNVAIPQGWGTFRGTCNLVWYGAFTAIPHTTKTSTGGKGGGSFSNTTWTYTASLILGLCKGQIAGVRSVYKDKSVFTDGATTALAQAGLSLANGAQGQAPWGYLTAGFPTQALGYTGLAYLYASGYDLGDSGSLANHAFEVQTNVRQVVGASTLDDANPKDIVTDFLTNSLNGLPFWQSGLMGDLTDYGNYCLASGLLLSPVLDSQRQASDFLTEILAATNADCVWSEGKLKIAPYGDTAVTGNGVTWTPNLTPVYDLGPDDFQDMGGDDPVQMDLKRPADAYNSVQVAFLDRSAAYAEDVVPALDQANIDAFGLRKADPQSLHSICDRGVATTVAQLLLQRSCYVRATYRFKLDWRYCLLEPHIDLVTLTISTPSLSLNRKLVRIVEMNESQDGDDFDVTAEEVLVGVANAPLITRQASDGYLSNFDADPGDVQHLLLFNPPTSLTSDNEVWAAACSTNPNWGGCELWVSLTGFNYQRAGRLYGSSRMGVTTASFASATDPDTTHTLSVDLSRSQGVIDSASLTDCDAFADLCLVGAELVSYQSATLTSAYHYDIGTRIRRGVYGTPVSTHASGSDFVRLDDAIFKFAYDAGQIGKTIYVKALSFNIYGRALQDLSAVTATTIVAGPAVAVPDQPTGLAVATGSSAFVGGSLDLVCNPAARATAYVWSIYKSDGTTLLRTQTTATPAYSYKAADAALDGVQRSYKVQVAAQNSAGTGTATSQYAVSDTAPAAITVTTSTGGATTASLAWNASSDPDLTGYVLYYSTSSGFNPLTTGQPFSTAGTSTSLYGLAAGTYYWKVAPYDAWTSNPSLLNFSAESSFTISSGGGSTPSGGGGSGGYAGRPNTELV